MDLNEIKDPSFLKDMSVEELNDLAGQIRSFLIHSVSRTGGHLASNLGVVELTIALHYVFDSPEDRIFFDVGHQSYVHKILTGRANRFDTLRQYDGLSGFQKRRESEHDVWEAGHSSTSLSAALGMAVSRDLRHETYHVVPVIGDGSISSGMALEALNSIGAEQRRLVIILNDNNMSISQNVGALSMNFARLRAAKTYNAFKRSVKNALNRNDLGKLVYHGLKTVKDTVRDSVVDRGIFGELNINYLGPVDGHNIADLIKVLQVAKEHERPVVVHVITKKGKGYVPCEIDREGKWHGVGPFNIETGKQIHEIPEGWQTWSCVAARAVEDLAAKDARICTITPAMITGSCLESFFARYPDRSFDCGIAEEHAVTFAAGMAVSGMRPFVSIYSSFLQRAYDQINHDVCRMDLPVVFGIDRAGLVGGDGETHHGIFDPGILKPLPNLIIAQPKNAEEAGDLFYTAFHQDHPFAVRYPRGETPVSGKKYSMIPVGSWEICRKPDNARAVVLTYGPDVERVCSKAEVNDIPVMVVNCRFFKPMDEACLDDIAGLNVPVIVYESDLLEGGLGTSVLEYYADRQMYPEVHRIGIRDHYVQQGSEKLLRKAENIAINDLMNLLNELL
ncbi:MAG: 1-deoxy-D-xylulose-5-phosphate synthase [Solobacterium sp.]|nr:1-deoxy-D-xylulose-5-phosphate synthase [Solobacterium sp.]